MMKNPTEDNALGTYLRNCRTRLDAPSLGYGGRRRTAGLRREEVADRANISPAWYTWLEQGRGGKPSQEVLDRLAQALLLTDVEREHLYLLGVGHRPEPHYRGGDDTIPASLQQLLDELTLSPAIVRTATWDIVAWNRAALAVLLDYESLPPQQRNILRLIFCDPLVRERQDDWETVARYIVASFRADAARAGAEAQIAPLVAELRATSPEFGDMWDDTQVQTHGESLKRIHHPEVGELALELNSLAVNGRPDLCLFVYTPATNQDRELIRSIVEAKPVHRR